MIGSWFKYKLSEIGTIVGGATPSTNVEAYYNGNIPWLTPKDLSDFQYRYIEKGKRNITKSGLNSCSAQFLPAGSVLFSSRAPIGYIAIAKNPIVTNQGFKSIIPDKEKVDSLFLYYLLKYKKNDIEALGSGTTFKEVSGFTMKNVEVFIPSLKVQQQIAGVLGALDDKIELNRRINENLEQQAQALFKSWFVDFEPFKDGKFVDSELGMIPEGWKVGNLEELVEVKYGKDHKKLASGDIPVYGSGGIMRYADKSLYDKESVLIPRKGSLNNVMYVNHPFWTVDTMFYTCMKIEGIAKFIYLLISPKDLLSMNSGSAVPSMTVDILNKIVITIPTTTILQKFESIVKPIFIMMESCSTENKKLAQLRDTLLPRLMSGELAITDVDDRSIFQ